MSNQAPVPPSMRPPMPPVSAEANEARKSASFMSYNTVQVADETTANMDIRIPGHGVLKEKLYVRSIHSTEYRAARLKAERQIRSLAQSAGPEGISEDLKDDIILRAMVTLVAGWEFDEPATPENVVIFLSRNPTVYDDLNMFVVTESNFFKKGENA